MISWGSGKAKVDRAPPVSTRNMVEWVGGEVPDLSGVYGECMGISEMEIALAYKLSRECINPDKRAGDYHDWVKFAILLKNISNTDESFRVWMEVSHNAATLRGQPLLSETELRRKWDLVRVGSSEQKLTIRSLMHWAE